MTTQHGARTRRHPARSFRKDTTDMLHIEFRLAEAEERQTRFRAEAERERFSRPSRRRFRHRLGHTLIRLGREIQGDALTEPLADATTVHAWPA